MAGETLITIVGNLTADPELRFTPSGAAVVNFTVASTPRTLDRQTGEWKDGDALFMRCNLWRQAAENVAESLTRGMRVIVTGRLRQRSFETREGEKRTVIELDVDEIGPSLRYATAKVNKTTRGNGGGFGGSSHPGTPEDDPWGAAPPAGAAQIDDEPRSDLTTALGWTAVRERSTPASPTSHPPIRRRGRPNRSRRAAFIQHARSPQGAVMATVITRSVVVHLVRPEPVTRIPLPVDLYWSSDDPYAIKASFHVHQLKMNRGRDRIEWVLSRDLLLEGSRTSTGVGIGDVHVRQEPGNPGVAQIRLSSPFGCALFVMDMGVLLRFLGETLQVVQLGQEYVNVDIDGEIARLLTDADAA